MGVSTVNICWKEKDFPMHSKRLGEQNFWPVKGGQIVRESNSQILKRLTVESSSRCEAKRFGSWYWDPGGHFPCLQKRTRISSKRELIFQANLNQIGFLPLPICDHILGSWFSIRSQHPDDKRWYDLTKEISPRRPQFAGCPKRQGVEYFADLATTCPVW